ncbi:MAG: AmmeMemoRadiSam system protein A [Deltaproteobacteria bacterium]
MSPPAERTDRPFHLADRERRELLGIARRAVAGWLRHGAIPGERPESGALTAPGAAFVTLTRGGRLRGCIGYTEASAPLYRTVQECAVAAATEDPRFPPVTEKELDSTRFEISVLSPLVPVRPEEVTVGRHGLWIRKGMRRGLLLPQVATEYGWDRATFLEQVCAKAGLPPDAWKRGADLRCFTAEVFGE